MPIFVVLVAIVVFLCIGAAGVFPDLLHAIALSACLAYLFLRRRPAGRSCWLAVAGAAVVGFMVLTVIPLPQALDPVIGSGRAAQNELARQAVTSAASLNLCPANGDPWFVLSRNRAGTMRMILLAIAAFAIAATSARMSPDVKGKYLRAMVLVAAVVAVVGFMSQWILPQGKQIWWLFDVLHGKPVGCFVDRNHFGGFVAMLCPPAMAVFADAATARRVGRAVFWGAFLCVMCGVVLMSMSRGAWIAGGIVGLAIIVMLFRRRQVVAGASILALAGCCLSAVMFIPNKELVSRLDTLSTVSEDSSVKLRMQTWEGGIGIPASYPLIGAGGDGFRMVFPQHRIDSERKHARYAENEYVQVLADYGLVGTLLIGVMLFCVARRWRENELEGSADGTVTLGVSGAVAVAGVHAGFDFPLQIPLYLIVLASLVGLVLSQRQATEATAMSRPFPLAAGIAALGIVGLISLSGRQVYTMDSSDSVVEAGPNELCKMLTWSPTSWQTWYHLGNASLRSAAEDVRMFGEQCIVRSLEYDPQNYQVWEKLYQVRHRRDDLQAAKEPYKTRKRLRSWGETIPELE